MSRDIVVVGGGLGGAETALTLALALGEDRVTLVTSSDFLRLSPHLVYACFGISSQQLEIPLYQLYQHGVHLRTGYVENIDEQTSTIEFADGTSMSFDILVAAPGMQSIDSHDRTQLRSLADAERIHRELQELVDSARSGYQHTIVLHASSEDNWNAPAYELALLMGAWIRAQKLQDKLSIFLATSELQVFEALGVEGSQIVAQALRRMRVHVASGVREGDFDELGGTLVIDMGQFTARTIDGLPGHKPDGWYHTDAHGRVAKNIYVLGDARALPIKAGFALAWQARDLAQLFGGDLRRLGEQIDGVDIHTVEYQMDLADGVLCAKIEQAQQLLDPYLGHLAEVSVKSGGRPDKLHGLLLRDRLRHLYPESFDAPLAFRDLLLAYTFRPEASGPIITPAPRTARPAEHSGIWRVAE